MHLKQEAGLFDMTEIKFVHLSKIRKTIPFLKMYSIKRVHLQARNMQCNVLLNVCMFCLFVGWLVGWLVCFSF